ncbi:MAG: hypothetical protein ACOC6E_01720 [Thermodesulfobacteriota bacterium]
MEVIIWSPYSKHTSFTIKKAGIFSFAGVSAANEKASKLCGLGALSEAGVEIVY